MDTLAERRRMEEFWRRRVVRARRRYQAVLARCREAPEESAAFAEYAQALAAFTDLVLRGVLPRTVAWPRPWASSSAS